MLFNLNTSILVIPAQAGIQVEFDELFKMDSRLRGNDGK
jgi:hypothetical protein